MRISQASRRSHSFYKPSEIQQLLRRYYFIYFILFFKGRISFIFFFFKLLGLFVCLFVCLFLAVLGLRFCARAFSSCGKWGPLFIAVRRPLLLRSTGSRRAGSVIVAHGLSRSAACGIFPDQGSNPCPLHWQADSRPLRHQGSPGGTTLIL